MVSTEEFSPPTEELGPRSEVLTKVEFPRKMLSLVIGTIELQVGTVLKD